MISLGIKIINPFESHNRTYLSGTSCSEETKNEYIYACTPRFSFPSNRGRARWLLFEEESGFHRDWLGCYQRCWSIQNWTLGSTRYPPYKPFSLAIKTTDFKTGSWVRWYDGSSSFLGPDACRIGDEEQNEWYFFSHKDKKYPTGTRTNRATTAGFWKATGRDKPIHSKHTLVGMRKTLVFYRGRAPNGQKSDYIMHEYRLETNENATVQVHRFIIFIGDTS